MTVGGLVRQVSSRSKAWLEPIERLAAKPAVRAGFTLAIVAIAAWVIHLELRDVSLRDVTRALARTRPAALALAALCTVCAYASLAVQEMLGLKFIGKRTP